MMNIDDLLQNKDDLDAYAEGITAAEIGALVDLLEEKNDEIRYAAFLTLQKRSREHSDVYPYWDVLAAKLRSENSYQRSIGIMLLAENVRWDEEKRFDQLAPVYLEHCMDEKFVTCRQTIQSLANIVLHRPDLLEMIKERLLAVDVMSFKETQRKLILLDILSILEEIDNWISAEDIRNYFQAALDSGLLDKKTYQRLQKRLAGSPKGME